MVPSFELVFQNHEERYRWIQCYNKHLHLINKKWIEIPLCQYLLHLGWVFRTPSRLRLDTAFRHAISSKKKILWQICCAKDSKQSLENPRCFKAAAVEKTASKKGVCSSLCQLGQKWGKLNTKHVKFAKKVRQNVKVAMDVHLVQRRVVNQTGITRRSEEVKKSKTQMN